MPNKKQLASDAIVKALQVRKQLNLAHDESVSAIDASEQLGIEVRLTNLPSMEGMYVGGKKPTIVLSSLRPQGRRNFTCAHEIGHHMMGHGEQFDELVKDRSFSRSVDPNEFQADCFAAFFLIPKVTLENGMKKRGYTYDTLDPIQIFKLSAWLGVSYSGVINHLVHGLGKISRSKGELLAKVQPRDIRRQLIGKSDMPHLVVVDEFWKGRAVDCEVGDYIIFPRNSFLENDSKFLVLPSINGLVVRASTPGVARVSTDLWSSFVRISPAQYNGRGCYRFEEEVD
ncbi:ImmA/IrrE family metallo-endopeptidase [Undibacterium sp. Ji42W]|uniref:ImmA/IrrE family metallo-endopeptidase n=1 Tax=Undibacterium sp. Ji42W TaxID=3413039 RepID=UPI003BF44157